MIEGHTSLILADKNGKVVDKIEKKNTVTPYVNDVLTKGNFGWSFPQEKISPLRQFFNGCYLTSEENDPSISMIAHNSEIVAQAGPDAYTGVNMRRGSYNSNESGRVANGFKFVWDWTTSQGNGDIKSVCLTRGYFGSFDFTEDLSERFPEGSFTEVLWYNTHDWNTYPRNFSPYGSVVDYEGERAYTFAYNNNATNPAFTVNEYFFPTKYMHIGYDRLERTLIATHTIPLSEPVANYHVDYSSLTYTGDTIHYIQWNDTTGGANHFVDYEISLDDWTYVKHVHIYENVRFTYQHCGGPLKDVVLIKDGYYYTEGLLGGVAKHLKLSMTNDADITSYPLSKSVVGPNSTWDEFAKVRYGRVPKLLLPNGDFFCRGSGDYYEHPSFWYHNGKYYNVRRYNTSYGYYGGMNGNRYGSMYLNETEYNTLALLAPFVSTVNNLGRTVSKTSDLTMKLSYTITEAEE